MQRSKLVTKRKKNKMSRWDKRAEWREGRISSVPTGRMQCTSYRQGGRCLQWGGHWQGSQGEGSNLHVQPWLFCSYLLKSLWDFWIHKLAVNSLLAPMPLSLRKFNNFSSQVNFCEHFHLLQLCFIFWTIGAAKIALEHISYLWTIYLLYLQSLPSRPQHVDFFLVHRSESLP